MSAANQAEETQTLEQLLVSKGWIYDGSLVYLGHGEAHDNYLADSDNGRVVVRVVRTDTPNNTGFANEHLHLRFLAEQGIDFAPRSLHYDETNDIHLISYVTGNDASVLDLSGPQRKTFVKQIARLETIAPKAFVDFCHQHNAEPTPSVPLKTKLDTNFTRRIQTIRDIGLPKGSPLNGQFEILVGYAEKYMSQTAPTKVTERYTHDDLRYNNNTSNLLLDGANVQFIDWENARFVIDDHLEVGDVISSLPHPEVSLPLIQDLVKLYLDNTKLDLTPTEILKNIQLSIDFSLAATPLWALERYCLMRAEGSSDIEQYAQKVQTGIRNLDFYEHYLIAS